MPEKITLILETAVAAKFITVSDVFEYGYDYKFHWSELATKLCQIAYQKRYENWEAWRFITEEAALFNAEWRNENW